MRILMVCLGNICRSPLAEGILQAKADKLELGWIVDSAGTNGYHTGEPPHRLSQKIAQLNGLDISGQCSRQFTVADMTVYDKIYVMASDVWRDVKHIAGSRFDNDKVDYFLNELYPGTNRDVPDPWYGAEDGYHEVYNIIDKTTDAIIAKYVVGDFRP